MKRILINATQNEEIRVALCKGNHLYDFDLENRTREQKKSNIYKGHVTRVEPSLEAVFVEYGSQRQGFLPIREISTEYLSGNPRDENIKKLIKEGDELIVQVEKEERGNKGAALSTYVSLAGRYLVLMPNNPRGGGISRQISGKLREDMKRMLGNLDLQKGMSVIIRTAGIGKTQEELQHDLNHLLNIWQAIQEQNQKYPSPRLVHQEAGVVTRAVRDYLRDDIAEIWIDNENAYIEAAGFIDAVMPKQADKLRKYTDYEPMFSRFNVEKQIETAYQREVRLPSGGSIVIDQTEALVSIDINSAKSTKGSDVAETAYHTNLEAADEIARQLRLRDMGGLIVIDFIDMNDNKHQKEVEKRLIDATKYDRARVQFGDISKFGLMEMSRQRLRPSLEESTGYICPRCHGNGMIRDLRSLSLSIMRQIEQIALKERQGEVQAEVPTDIAAFLLNEKRDSLVYLEQDSGTRITILPHAHLESPNFKLHFNRDGFAPSSYERITDTQQQEHSDLGYNVDWQTAEKERPEQQPTRQPRKIAEADKNADNKNANTQPNGREHPTQNQNQNAAQNQQASAVNHSNEHRNHGHAKNTHASAPVVPAPQAVAAPIAAQASAVQPQAVAWLSNLFAQAPQAQTANSVSSRDAAEAIEALVNTGAQSLGSFGQVDSHALTAQTSNNSSQNAAAPASRQQSQSQNQPQNQPSDETANRQPVNRDTDNNTDTDDNRRRKPPRKSRPSKPRQRREPRDETGNTGNGNKTVDATASKPSDSQEKREDSQRSDNNRRTNERNRNNRQDSGRNGNSSSNTPERQDDNNTPTNEPVRSKRKPHSQRRSRGNLERGDTLTADKNSTQNNPAVANDSSHKAPAASTRRHQEPNEIVLQVSEAPARLKLPEVVRLSLDDSKSEKETAAVTKQMVTSPVAIQPEIVESKAVISGETKPKQSVPAVVVPPSKDESVTTASTENLKSAERIESTATKNAEHPESVKHPENTENTKSKEPVTATVAITATSSENGATQQAEATTEAVKDNAAETVESVQQSVKSSAEENSAKEDVIAPAIDSHLAIVPTHDALFAKRYITANKFGQASNDPRAVRQQQTATAAVSTQVAEPECTKLPAINGTVGAFIRAILPDADNRLANEGVIQSFIAAIAQYQAQATEDSQAHQTDTTHAKTSDFDFSNYGYQPLNADYLTQFHTMTQPVSHFAAEQGKTEVTPRLIGQRASNDPRGQHPDYPLSEPAKPVAPSTEISPEALPIDVAAQDIAATALTEPLHTDTVTQNNVPVADEQPMLVETASAEISPEIQAQPDNSDTMTAENLAKDDQHAGKSKTTIASYKNMIENVAEQLLPQTSMFSLTTPKVPKARTRKPKTEHKKPTQADNLNTDNDHTHDEPSNNDRS